MNYIHLKHYHTKTKRFKNPLTDAAPPFDFETLNDEAALVIDGKDPEELILMLGRIVGLLVSRYLGNFPQTKKLEEEMVGEGYLAICELCANIPAELFEERGIQKIAESRAQNAIETMLNDMIAMSAASARQQRYLIEKDEDPIYLQVEIDKEHESKYKPDEGDEWKRDVLDAVDRIEPLDDIDRALLDQLNWGRKYQELADELGVGVGTLHRRKNRLYEMYLELTS